MSIAFDEIQKRHSKRCAVIRESRQLKPPMLTDSESVKEFQKMLKDKQSELINECFLVDQDVQVLIVAMRLLVANKYELEKAVSNAWDTCWQTVPAEEQDIYHRRSHEQKEQEVKDAKAKGEVPGQMKIVKDDDSIADAATPVSSRKIKGGE